MAAVTTKTPSTQGEEDGPVLTQEELVRWWPFTRLALHRFPKTKKAAPNDACQDCEEALL